MGNNTYSECAAGLYHKITDNPIQKLTILYKVLLIFHDLSKYLQSPEISWSSFGAKLRLSSGS